MPRRARRRFTPEFKAQVVLDLLRGERSQAEWCRQHQLGASLLALWKDAFLQRLPLVFQADETRGQEQQRIADLEQLVGPCEWLKTRPRQVVTPPCQTEHVYAFGTASRDEFPRASRQAPTPQGRLPDAAARQLEMNRPAGKVSNPPRSLLDLGGL